MRFQNCNSVLWWPAPGFTPRRPLTQPLITPPTRQADAARPGWAAARIAMPAWYGTSAKGAREYCGSPPGNRSRTPPMVISARLA